MCFKSTSFRRKYWILFWFFIWASSFPPFVIGTALCDHHISPQIPVTPQSGKWIKVRSGMVQGSSSDKLMLRLHSKPAQPQVFRLEETLITQSKMKVDGDPMKGSRRIWLWWDASRSARETGLSHSQSKPRNNKHTEWNVPKQQPNNQGLQAINPGSQLLHRQLQLQQFVLMKEMPSLILEQTRQLGGQLGKGQL